MVNTRKTEMKNSEKKTDSLAYETLKPNKLLDKGLLTEEEFNIQNKPLTD
tara:strand:- start:293 stop:442 length:150 start_codon:yes stop_codon:yes gene_type:complete